MTDSARWVYRKALLRLQGITDAAAERIITEEQVEWARNERLGISNTPVTKRAPEYREMILDALRQAGFDPAALPHYRSGASDPAKQAAKSSLVKDRGGSMTESQFTKTWQSLLDAKEIQRR